MGMPGDSEKVRRLKKGEAAARLSTFITLGMAILKAAIGYLSGSVALLTDALHTGADSITRFASWFGLKIAQRKPDERFPYGYYKAETIATLFVSIFILYAGYEMIVESYSKLFEAPQLLLPFWALFASLISAFVALLISRYLRRVGEEVNSQSLIVNSEEAKIDVFASIVVFVAVFSSYLGVPYVEGAVGIGISLMIFKVGLVNGKAALYSLMDVSPSREIEEKIKRVLSSIEEVKEYEGLKLRQAGPYIFGEVKIKVKKFIDVKRAHEISERIEERIRREISQIDSFTIQVEPFKARVQRVAIPIEEDMGLNSRVTDHFGRANYFLIVTLHDGNVKSTSVMKNPFREREAKAGLAAVYALLEQGIDVLITTQIGDISFHTLRDHLIDVYVTPKHRTVGEIIDDYVHDRLPRLERPTKKTVNE